MVSIAAPEAEVQAAVAPHASAVSIAAVNGPEQVVIAGAEAEVQAIASAFASRGVRTKPLVVSHAFHAPQMEPMLEEFRRVAETVSYQRPTLALVSNVSGALCTEEVSTAAYWVRHVREAVRFGDGVKALHAAGAGTFVEVGPKATLLGLVPACLSEGAEPVLIASLRAGREESVSVLEALGGHWAAGGSVDWSALFPAGGRRVPLPTYAWQRERYWLDAPTVSTTRVGEDTNHPLLGMRVPAAGTGAVFESVLELAQHPWLGDHCVAGQVVVPGVALVELVRAAAAHGAEFSTSRVTGLVLQAPLVVPRAGARRVQVLLGETTGDGVTATVYSQPAESGPGEGWTLHATARVVTEPEEAQPGLLDLAAVQARCVEALNVDALYASIAEVGLAYGPAFRGLKSLWRGKGESLAEVALPANAPVEGYAVSPALLDAAFHAVGAAMKPEEAAELFLPFEIGGFAVHQPGVESAWVHVQLRSGSDNAGVEADVTLANAAGAVVVEVTGLRLQRADREALRRVNVEAAAEAFYQLEWREVPLPDVPVGRLEGWWVVVATAESAAAASLAARLENCLVTEPSGLRSAGGGARGSAARGARRSVGGAGPPEPSAGAAVVGDHGGGGGRARRWGAGRDGAGVGSGPDRDAGAPGARVHAGRRGAWCRVARSAGAGAVVGGW
jgi:polyketide synthase 12/epothilone polyketide synthase D